MKDDGKLKVVCWLFKPWTKYHPGINSYSIDHVRAWRNMVDRNLDMPHECVCITDQPDQVPEGMRCVPLWPDLMEYGGCFFRLRAFTREIGREFIGGRFVSMDLDCVVMGKLDPLFDRNEPLVFYSVPGRIQGSMWMMSPGTFPEFWDDMDSSRLHLQVKRCRNSKKGERKHYIHWDAKKAGFTIGTDQSWMAYKMSILTPERRCKIGYWTYKDGVLNNGVAAAFNHTAEPPPEHTRIVFFSGPADPAELTEKVAWIGENYG